VPGLNFGVCRFSLTAIGDYTRQSSRINRSTKGQQSPHKSWKSPSFQSQLFSQVQFNQLHTYDEQAFQLLGIAFIPPCDRFDIINRAPARARMRLIVRVTICIPKRGTSSVGPIIHWTCVASKVGSSLFLN
jgi:hypothetical protein